MTHGEAGSNVGWDCQCSYNVWSFMEEVIVSDTQPDKEAKATGRVADFRTLGLG